MAVRIQAAIDGGRSARAIRGPVYARRDQPVTLYAVLTFSQGDRTAIFSDAPGIVGARPLAEAPRTVLEWNRIEPAISTMSNGDTPAEFHFATIDYRPTPIANTTNRGAITADVRPTLTPDYGDGVGTMRFQLVARRDAVALATPGNEARAGTGSGGLSDAVLRVSIRRDDSYLGFMTEMFGQPYIWASAGVTDATHQSERLEGADCADLIIYGQRRLGHRLAYTWTGGLADYTQLLATASRGDDGVYRDHHGQPIRFPALGDLVLFPRHVGVLAADRGTIGVLDDRDVMMHTLFDSPREQPIGDTSYADKPIEVRRFR